MTPRGDNQRLSSDPPWVRLTDEELLDVRMSELGLHLADTPVAPRVKQLYQELKDHNLRFRPTCWLSDEWFAPDKMPGIAIPFYLAHQRLGKLEDRQMLEVEGGTKTWCMQLLRHEAGHAIETAFRLSRRPRWKKIFGDASSPYPEHYSPKPFSRSHVLHLDWWYAQSHPTEDFAETFAVWLKPASQWRRRYRKWPALKKLEYVDELMRQIAGRQPYIISRALTDPLHRLDRTLREHYQAKQQRYGSRYPDFYDRDLDRLFSELPEHITYPSAVSFLRRVRRPVRKLVASWTGEYSYTIDLVLKEMISRSRERNLRITRPADDVKLELAVWLTKQTMSYVHSRNHRIAI